jgi:hypothetical protein
MLKIEQFGPLFSFLLMQAAGCLFFTIKYDRISFTCKRLRSGFVLLVSLFAAFTALVSLFCAFSPCVLLAISSFFVFSIIFLLEALYQLS